MCEITRLRSSALKTFQVFLISIISLFAKKRKRDILKFAFIVILNYAFPIFRNATLPEPVSIVLHLHLCQYTCI